jgi:hypothetical protein
LGAEKAPLFVLADIPARVCYRGYSSGLRNFFIARVQHVAFPNTFNHAYATAFNPQLCDGAAVGRAHPYDENDTPDMR